MIRKTSLFTLLAVAGLGGQASAQVIVPGGLPNAKQPVPLIELQRAFEQAALAQRPGGKSDGSLNWGGVRLNKVNADMQQQLGLGEKEGLVVMAVDPNSAGDKAGLKANDVLVKVNNESIPNDLEGFAKVLKNQKIEDAADLVVVRQGKEETLKAAKMPAGVNVVPGAGGLRRPPIGGIAIGGIRINPVNPRPNPLQPFDKLHLEMTINGAKIVRDQDRTQFSGEYSKGELKVTVTGKMDNGRAVPSEFTVTEGKETKKYNALKDVPVQHRAVIQQIMPSAINSMLMMPALPNFDFPALPALPGFEN